VFCAFPANHSAKAMTTWTEQPRGMHRMHRQRRRGPRKSERATRKTILKTVAARAVAVTAAVAVAVVLVVAALASTRKALLVVQTPLHMMALKLWRRITLPCLRS